MQHSLSNGQKRMDWGSRRKELVLDLGELLESPDGLTGVAHIAVGFGERAVQVLLETGRLLPHRQPPPRSWGPAPQAASAPESSGRTAVMHGALRSDERKE